MNIVYMLWGQRYAVRLMQSLVGGILHARRHMEDSIDIHVLLEDNDELKPIVPFLVKNNVHILPLKMDSNNSLFIKFLNFHDLLDRFESFLYLDVDTKFRKKIPDALNIKHLAIAAYAKPDMLSKEYVIHMNPDSFMFFSRVVNLINRPVPHSCTCVVGVDQRGDNKKFWNKYRESSHKLIDVFMNKIDCLNEAEAKINYGNIYNDEHYFAMAIEWQNLRAKDCHFNRKIFNGKRTSTLSHHPLYTKKDRQHFHTYLEF